MNLELGSPTGEGLFVLSAFESAYLAIADQLAVDGQDRADYQAVFPKSMVSRAGSNLLPHFNTVDGDLVAPYVAAWVKRAMETGESFSAANFQKAGYLVPGSSESSRVFAANAAYRAMGNGLITGSAWDLMSKPSTFKGDFGGNLRDAMNAVLEVPGIVVKGAAAATDYAQYLPFAVVGAGLLYLMWFTAPARKAGKRVTEAFR